MNTLYKNTDAAAMLDITHFHFRKALDKVHYTRERLRQKEEAYEITQKLVDMLGHLELIGPQANANKLLKSIGRALEKQRKIYLDAVTECQVVENNIASKVSDMLRMVGGQECDSAGYGVVFTQ
ncbi:hypothetical protein [Noviherbaspirillum pedocola]|uniref:Uncharacterized protein n=1 Tax=Noviherbaspirillum pedocola TaxID=2801341 RepID=A0A934W619_9BURK|nr:hypothetical protein [Noviherbaspirillum pedocola]MBK4733029.1 hypothetical protein [Noviherbaspirillum pedocola]